MPGAAAGAPPNSGVRQTQVDIYYDGDWHTVYNGTDNWLKQWKEVMFAEQIITAARIRGYNDHTSVSDDAEYYEFNFHGERVEDNPSRVEDNPSAL